MFLPNIHFFIYTTALVTGLWLLRCWYTHSSYFGFLLWNIFLAFIPYIISSYLHYYLSEKPITKTIQHLQWWAGFAAWLLFFPNAPYIITDLIHLGTNSNKVPRWYDAILLFSAASTGLWAGYLSLRQMVALWEKIVPAVAAKWLVAGTFLLSGFGIYMGRILRFNSWDMITRPITIIEEVIIRVCFPWQHPQTWGITLLFALALWIGYQSTAALLRLQDE